MIIHCDPVTTFYSKVTTPTYKGLLSLNVGISYESVITFPRMILKISPTFSLQSMDRNFVHEVLKSQSVYNFLTDGSVSINELYNFSKEAVKIMSDHLATTSFQQPPKEIQPPDLASVIESLTAIVNDFNGNGL